MNLMPLPRNRWATSKLTLISCRGWVVTTRLCIVVVSTHEVLTVKAGCSKRRKVKGKLDEEPAPRGGISVICTC
ncbi:hypothetical protein M378DRAFT_516199 [Amanita muscaria Koide BX008]|uniref:Uncharacterized protein n=1 Tax=Amanita muscaria (strain Koide BX008) TaxID=946122 RepID=A0A0C2X9V4_AMAMK|nr:hypothetical protein M378DRAFT_516199 [Amanita muscaria Koide BX008]